MYPSKDANNQHIYQIIYKQQKALRYLKSCIKKLHQASHAHASYCNADCDINFS